MGSAPAGARPHSLVIALPHTFNVETRGKGSAQGSGKFDAQVLVVTEHDDPVQFCTASAIRTDEVGHVDGMGVRDPCDGGLQPLIYFFAVYLPGRGGAAILAGQ